MIREAGIKDWFRSIKNNLSGKFRTVIAEMIKDLAGTKRKVVMKVGDVLDAATRIGVRLSVTDATKILNVLQDGLTIIAAFNERAVVDELRRVARLIKQDN